jgi:hypothetical protein
VLRWRIVTAVVLAPLAVLALMLGKWAVLAVVFLLVARAAQELARVLQPLPFPAAQHRTRRTSRGGRFPYVLEQSLHDPFR